MVQINKRRWEPTTGAFYTNDKMMFVRQPVLIGHLVFYREYSLSRGEVLGDPTYTASCRYTTFRTWVKYTLEPAEIARLKIPAQEPIMGSPAAQSLNALLNRRPDEQF